MAVTGKFFPEEAKFTYDSKSREVIWNIGEIDAYQSVDGVPTTLAFQIELKPDESQKGTTPLLVNEAEFSGEDVFTLEIIREKAGEVNTTLPDDKTVDDEEGIVQ